MPTRGPFTRVGLAGRGEYDRRPPPWSVPALYRVLPGLRSPRTNPCWIPATATVYDHRPDPWEYANMSPPGEEGMTTCGVFGEIISAYTRANAIEDGVLVEVPRELCEEAGITVQVALTATVWGLVDPGDLEEQPGQSITGRLWDILYLLVAAARQVRGEHRSEVSFLWSVMVRESAPDGCEITMRRGITLRAVCGPGDHGEPVVTVMLPGED